MMTYEFLIGNDGMPIIAKTAKIETMPISLNSLNLQYVGYILWRGFDFLTQSLYSGLTQVYFHLTKTAFL